MFYIVSTHCLRCPTFLGNGSISQIYKKGSCIKHEKPSDTYIISKYCHALNNVIKGF